MKFPTFGVKLSTYHRFQNGCSDMFYVPFRARFEARSQIRGKNLLASFCLSVLPFARMQQLDTERTDFHEI